MHMFMPGCQDSHFSNRQKTQNKLHRNLHVEKPFHNLPLTRNVPYILSIPTITRGFSWHCYYYRHAESDPMALQLPEFLQCRTEAFPQEEVGKLTVESPKICFQQL